MSEGSITDEITTLDRHILPHEQTRTDIATQSTLSKSLSRQGSGPIWALADIDILDAVNEVKIGPIARTTDIDGFSHRLFALPQPAAQEIVIRAIEATVLVLADGHHRVRAAMEELENSPKNKTIDLICFVCQTKDMSKVIRPIHRIFTIDSIPAVMTLLKSKFGTSLELEPTDEKYIEIHTQSGINYVKVPKLVSATLFELEEFLDEHSPTTIEYSASREDAVDAAADPKTLSMICPAIPAAEILYSALRHRPLKPKTTLFYPKPLEWMILGESL